jgi:hypothetical protein
MFLRVGFVSKHTDLHLGRQIPAHMARNVDFRFGEASGVDALVVLDGIEEPLETDVPKERRVHICTEPPAIRVYNAAYLRQFGHVVTVDRSLRHPGRLLSQPGSNWFYGLDLSEGRRKATLATFEAIAQDPTPKSALVSVIVSDKCVTRGQHFRLRMVDHLARLLGDDLHVFGRGHRPIADKRDAIAPYRFHIALENSILDHYWTEKLADAFLGRSFPIYRGAPDLGGYFDADAFVAIPDHRPVDAANRVLRAIRALEHVDLTQPIERAREAVLRRHNLVALIARITDSIAARDRTPRLRAPEVIRRAATFENDDLSRALRRRTKKYRQSYWRSRGRRSALALSR